MSRIAGSSAEVAYRELRRRFVPALSTLLACLVSTMPVVVQSPVLPDFGFLVLITWRLLRPEIWPAYVALGLGLFNDLVSGHPIGQSMALWTVLFLLFDALDSQTGFRDYWLDWVVAAVAIIFHTAGAWYIARTMGSPIPFSVMVPQLLLSILAYPLVARLVLGLDRWRLAR